MEKSGKEMKSPPHPVNSAQRETTHNCLLQTLEVLLGLFMSLVQKSGARRKHKSPSGPSFLPLSSISIPLI